MTGTGIAALAVTAGCAADASYPAARPAVTQDARFTLSIPAGVRHRVTVPNVLPPRVQPLLWGGRSPIRRSAVWQRSRTPSGGAAFVSDYNNNAVYVLNASGTVTATLTGFTNPEGLATDSAGDLYVANTGAQNVVELAPPYTGPPLATFNDSGEYPGDVAVDANGNLAVTNLETTAGAAGNIVFYRAGSTSPTGSASSPTFTSPRFCAFDKYGDLALDDNDQFNTGAVNIGGVVGGINGNGTIVTLTTNNSITFPGGVQVSSSGQLAVLDQIGDGSGPAIYTYNAPTTLNLGSPASTTLLANDDDPAGFAFLPGSTLVLTVDAVFDSVLLYDYPAGGSPIKTEGGAPGGAPIGVAIDPTEQFTLR